uniref:Uncharacterized protein n=1 Tax=Anguilla anguilla TaxID=7936 RepID=A0A0E9WZ39_ANGAN
MPSRTSPLVGTLFPSSCMRTTGDPPGVSPTLPLPIRRLPLMSMGSLPGSEPQRRTCQTRILPSPPNRKSLPTSSNLALYCIRRSGWLQSSSLSLIYCNSCISPQCL